MNLDNYQYIDINGVSIAYTDSGQENKETVLLVHGFASFSFTWQKLLEFFPENIRTVCIDLKGYGYSEKLCDDNLSPFDQSQILNEFIKKLDLKDFSLIGHSMGGAISLLTLFDPEIESRVRKLILIDTAGLFQKIPDFIDDLMIMTPNNPLLRLTDENLMARMVLETVYHDKSKIKEEVIKEYADILRLDKAKECLIGSAKQIAIANVRSFHKKCPPSKFQHCLSGGKRTVL
jgi:pimeloyl-ACP methyl ester carboxylesterase